MTQKNTDEMLKLQEKLKENEKNFEIEKVKIQQERENEKRKMLEEKTRDLDKAKKQCEELIMKEKNGYTQEINKIKERESLLAKTKEKLEQDQKEHDRNAKKKMEEDKKKHEEVVKKLKQEGDKLKSQMDAKVKEFEEKLNNQKTIDKKMFELQIEEIKLQQRLKQLEYEAEIRRLRNNYG